MLMSMCFINVSVIFSFDKILLKTDYLKVFHKSREKGENPRIKKRTEPPCPLGMTHTLLLSHTHTQIKLTHSTSLTKPRGSFSGDKLSRNPVIMIDPLVQKPPTLYPVVAELWMLVQRGGKKGELSDRVTWV